MIRDAQRLMGRATERARDAAADRRRRARSSPASTENELPPVSRWAVVRDKRGAEVRLYVEDGEARDPLLATWQYELGRVAVVPLDFQGGAAGWPTWRGFGKLWTQLAEWAAPRGLAERPPPRSDAPPRRHAHRARHRRRRRRALRAPLRRGQSDVRCARPGRARFAATVPNLRPGLHPAVLLGRRRRRDRGARSTCMSRRPPKAAASSAPSTPNLALLARRRPRDRRRRRARAGDRPRRPSRGPPRDHPARRAAGAARARPGARRRRDSPPDPALTEPIRIGKNRALMTYIITRLCRDCVDTACVAVCPVDCIYAYKGTDHDDVPEPALHPPRRVHRLRRVRARVPLAGHFRGGDRPGTFPGRHPAQLQDDGAQGRLRGQPDREERAPERGGDRGQQAQVGARGLVGGDDDIDLARLRFPGLLLLRWLPSGTRAAAGSPAGPAESERCDRRGSDDRRSGVDRRVAAAHGTHRATGMARTNVS